MGTISDTDTSKAHSLKRTEEGEQLPPRSDRVRHARGEWWKSSFALIREFPDTGRTYLQGTKGTE